MVGALVVIQFRIIQTYDLKLLFEFWVTKNIDWFLTQLLVTEENNYMIYLLNIYVYWSKSYINKINLNIIGTLKDPKEHCIENLYPQMSEHLSNPEAANAFFFS